MPAPLGRADSAASIAMTYGLFNNKNLDGGGNTTLRLASCAIAEGELARPLGFAAVEKCQVGEGCLMSAAIMVEGRNVFLP